MSTRPWRRPTSAERARRSCDSHTATGSRTLCRQRLPAPHARTSAAARNCRDLCETPVAARSVVGAAEVLAEGPLGAGRPASLDQVGDRLVLGEHLLQMTRRSPRPEAHHPDEAAKLAEEPLDDRQPRGGRDVQVELLVELDEPVLVAGVDGTLLADQEQA